MIGSFGGDGGNMRFLWLVVRMKRTRKMANKEKKRGYEMKKISYCCRSWRKSEICLTIFHKLQCRRGKRWVCAILESVSMSLNSDCQAILRMHFVCVIMLIGYVCVGNLIPRLWIRTSIKLKYFFKLHHIFSGYPLTYQG